MPLTLITSPLAALLALSSMVRAETNYCHDPETNATWEQIRRSHRGERDVEALIALRENCAAKSMLAP